MNPSTRRVYIYYYMLGPIKTVLLFNFGETAPSADELKLTNTMYGEMDKSSWLHFKNDKILNKSLPFRGEPCAFLEFDVPRLASEESQRFVDGEVRVLSENCVQHSCSS